LFFFHLNSVVAQVVGTPYIVPSESRYLPEVIPNNTSFGLSTRKISRDYTGFAMRVRRNSDNAIADIAFDSNQVVSDESLVTVTNSGTSGLLIGSTLTLANFRTTANLFVTIWYDQSINGFNAIQNTVAYQPELKLYVAGVNNQYAAVLFVGESKQSVVVNQPLNVLLTNSLSGTLAFIARTSNVSINSHSFGYFDTINSQNRWSIHMNWSDGNCYSDFGNATDNYRAHANASNNAIYKQFTFIRNTNTKITRISRATKINTSQNVIVAPYLANVAVSSFGIGTVSGGSPLSYIGYSGHVPEIILFKDALNVSQADALESNQLLFWGSN